MRFFSFNSLWLAFVVCLGVIVFGACLVALLDFRKGHFTGVSVGCFEFYGSSEHELQGFFCRPTHCPDAKVGEWVLYFPEDGMELRVESIVSRLQEGDGPTDAIADIVRRIDEEPDGTQQVDLGPYWLEIHDGQILRFTARRTTVDGKDIYPTILLPNHSEPITFPITRGEIAEFTSSPQFEQRYHGW